MARIRTLKPEYFRSRSLARCTRDARLTFAGLWCEADSAGRGVAEPRILKGAIWPLDDDITPDVIAQHLEELARDHLDVYEVDGETFFAIRNWEKHQAASYRQGEPKHPAPPQHALGTSSHADCTTPSAGREGKGRERAAHDNTSSGAPPTRPGDGFDDWWDRYPRKVAKKAARKAWTRLKPADRQAARTALDAHCAIWARGDPKFIPHPASWLNAARWEDTLTTPTAPPVAVNGTVMSRHALERM